MQLMFDGFDSAKQEI